MLAGLPPQTSGHQLHQATKLAIYWQLIELMATPLLLVVNAILLMAITACTYMAVKQAEMHDPFELVAN